MDRKKTQLGLTLLSLKGFGRVKARKIIESIEVIPETTSEIQQVIQHVVKGKEKKLPTFNDLDIKIAMDKADRILDACDRQEIRTDFIEPNEERNWINRYAMIPSAPLVLYSLGDPSVLDMPTMAIIGTRNPTPTGIKAAKSIAKKSVEYGFCVVSGLAFGCDIAAHKATLENRGKTVAILAHGLNEVHPSQHTEIAAQITEKGGCLLSEYPPGSEIERGNFVDRDRLQSGGSLGVIVIETTIGGGSMHTVRFAEKQNRLIGCLNHPPKYHKLKSVEGNRKLIEDGKYKIWEPEEIEDFLQICSQQFQAGEKVEAAQETLF